MRKLVDFPFNKGIAMFSQLANGQQPQLPPQVLQALLAQKLGAMPPQGIPPQGMAQPPQPPQAGQAPPQAPPPPPMQGGMPPRPPMPPQGGPPPGMPQGAPPPSPQGPPSQGQGGIPPQILQMLMQHLQQQAPQQLAQQGRFGDTMIAHLTPGEMMVPPQVQTPKVLAELDKAYKAKHVSPGQFTAGSPQSSTNPKTGVPEYNFMSAFLPTAAGLAATAATGGLAAPTLFSALAGGAAAGAAGLATGQTPTQALLTGAGQAGGAYVGGNLGSGSSALGGTPSSALNGAQAAVLGAKDPAAAYSAAQSMGIQGLNSPAASATSGAASGATGAGSAASTMGPIQPSALQNSISNNFGSTLGHMVPSNPVLGASLGGMAGSYLGNSIGAPPKSNSPNYPAGFNSSMPPVGSLGSAQQQLGMTHSAQPTPSFTGYNPATNNPASYNFYPGSQ